MGKASRDAEICSRGSGSSATPQPVAYHSGFFPGVTPPLLTLGARARKVSDCDATILVHEQLITQDWRQ
jgi:hypothetical protein